MQQARALVDGGYLAAGYQTISLDDCWEAAERDVNGDLAMDPERFPSGPYALGNYFHGLGVKFGIYSDEGNTTCQGYPGSKGNESRDAGTFAEWGVDYLKMDGCANDEEGYADGYPKMGSALAATGRKASA